MLLFVRSRQWGRVNTEHSVRSYSVDTTAYQRPQMIHCQLQICINYVLPDEYFRTV